jgi:hypothetical protein
LTPEIIGVEGWKEVCRFLGEIEEIYGNLDRAKFYYK